MKRGVAIAILAGMACAIAVVAYFGAGAILSAATAVGWVGFAVLCCYALATYLPLGAAWRVLTTATKRQLHSFMFARLIRDAATELLPFSSIGGVVLGARAATVLADLPTPVAYASSLVDLTTELFAQIAFVLIGIGLWVLRLNPAYKDPRLFGAVIVGLVVFIVGSLGFFLMQRRGLRTLSSWLDRFLPGAAKSSAAFHANLEAIYDRPLVLACSAALHLAAWLASAFGVWIAFRFIHAAPSALAVITLEALICAVRSLAFIVPSALGVQEAGYAVIAPMFGIAPQLAVAISLLKRAREVATGVVALACWQFIESGRILRRGDQGEIGDGG